jgi:hypothetical protein
VACYLGKPKEPGDVSHLTRLMMSCLVLSSSTTFLGASTQGREDLLRRHARAWAMAVSETKLKLSSLHPNQSVVYSTLSELSFEEPSEEPFRFSAGNRRYYVYSSVHSPV